MSADWKARRDWAARLRAVMRERGLTQRALAEAIGTTQSTVSGWVARQSYPRGDGLYRLGRALGVSMVWLLCGGPDGVCRVHGAEDLYRAA